MRARFTQRDFHAIIRPQLATKRALSIWFHDGSPSISPQAELAWQLDRVGEGRMREEKRT